MGPSTRTAQVDRHGTPHATTSLTLAAAAPEWNNVHPQKERLTVANIKSQKKRILTNEKRRRRNQAVKSELKTAVKKVRTAVAAGDKDAAATAQREAARKLDKAVSKGVIHKNQAANRKSGLAQLVNSL